MIYLISDVKKEYCKIGYTQKDPLSRLCSIQVGNPIELEISSLIEGSIKLEKQLHKKFEEYYIRGEWFIYNDNIINYFNSYPQLEVVRKKRRIKRKDFILKEEDLIVFNFLKSLYNELSFNMTIIRIICEDNNLNYTKTKHSVKVLVKYGYITQLSKMNYIIFNN